MNDNWLYYKDVEKMTLLFYDATFICLLKQDALSVPTKVSLLPHLG